MLLKSTNRCAAEVSRSSAPMYADVHRRWYNAMLTRHTADAMQQTAADAVPMHTVDSARCTADTTQCQLEPSLMRCDALPRKKLINASKSTRWNADEVSWSPQLPYRRWMITSDLQLRPTAYWWVWNKQDFIKKDFIDLSVNCPVHTYAASNQFLFFWLLFSLLLIDTGLWTLLQLQHTVAQFNLFCRMSTLLMLKVCRQSYADSRRNWNRILFTLHVVALRNCSHNLWRSYFVSLIAATM